jgi:hypothetical protein
VRLDHIIVFKYNFILVPFPGRVTPVRLRRPKRTFVPGKGVFRPAPTVAYAATIEKDARAHPVKTGEARKAERQDTGYRNQIELHDMR